MVLRRIILWIIGGLCLSPTAAAAPLDTTADAVVGQVDMFGFDPNQPSGSPTASNLALSNAAHFAVAPDGRLYVSDADNHRILSWPSARQFMNGAASDMVIGQPDFTSNAMNAGGLGPGSLALPQGLSVDEAGNLWVADAFNSRVLKFNNPLIDVTPYAADLVVGQPDFTSAAPNLGGGFFDVDVATADSLCFPGRVLVRGADVWIADSGNSRVLHYTNPAVNLPGADAVLGQFESFNCRVKNNDGTCGDKFGTDARPENLFNPIGLALSPDGALFVADWANHRVLRFDDPMNSATADAVLGQPDLFSNGPDAGGAATGLELPIDLFVDGTGALYVADSGNNRVLVYSDPLLDDIPSLVFGQLGDLSADSPNHGLGLFATDADGLFGPTGVSPDLACNLLVVDTNNSRVLRFDIPLRRCGDLNCDEVVDLDDAAAFALLLVDAPAHADEFDGCDSSLADFNNDGRTDGADVRHFISCLLGTN